MPVQNKDEQMLQFMLQLFSRRVLNLYSSHDKTVNEGNRGRVYLLCFTITFLVWKYTVLTNYFYLHKTVCASQGSADYHLITVLVSIVLLGLYVALGR